MTRLTLLSAWEQRHCPLSAPHAAARAPCIAFGKCQQEFKTTLRSSTALNVLVSGDEEKLKEERSEISHTIRHTAPSPSPHTHTHTLTADRASWTGLVSKGVSSLWFSQGSWSGGRGTRIWGAGHPGDRYTPSYAKAELCQRGEFQRDASETVPSWLPNEDGWRTGSPCDCFMPFTQFRSQLCLGEQRANSARLTELDAGPCSDWYLCGVSPWRQRLQSHNEKDGSLKRCQQFHGCICFRLFLWAYTCREQPPRSFPFLFHLVPIWVVNAGQLQLFSMELSINVAI